ncbi:probable esterase PIR7A [Miscanthus floridulus]|uniref:probable esterase PIR7A n=1 Tax=Miscanthus floridulus TaxID=154761 RepID=UPI00345A2B0D
METNGRGNQEEPHPQHHFVLVHGLCHGAWCWYKAATALRRAGHRVTAPDMAGCGAHPARVDEVRSFEEYSRPLLDAVAALPPGERAVLVGHSHGGCSVALAAERFPDKVAAAVFVAASMPAVGRSMGATTTDEFLKFVGAEPDFFLDTKELHQENPNIPGRPVIFGPKFTAQRLYQLSPPEDLTLALSLIRPANRFNEDALMTDEKLLTEAGYGSARRVFVVVEDDLGIPAEFQRRMIAQSPGVEVEAMTAGGADHMAMLSRPEELVDLLLRIAAINGV